MFYLVLKNTVVSGVKAKAGDVVEINDTNESTSLVAMGRVEATSAPQPKKVKAPKKVANRAVTDFETPEAD